MDSEMIDMAATPSGTGCKECTASGGWWFHLRRCARCGHIGCCDSSPSQHATHHFRETGHSLIRSFEPGETWWWDFRRETMYETGPELAGPHSHPGDQAVPGPSGRVPQDWQAQLH